MPGGIRVTVCANRLRSGHTPRGAALWTVRPGRGVYAGQSGPLRGDDALRGRVPRPIRMQPNTLSAPNATADAMDPVKRGPGHPRHSRSMGGTAGDWTQQKTRSVVSGTAGSAGGHGHGGLPGRAQAGGGRHAHRVGTAPVDVPPPARVRHATGAGRGKSTPLSRPPGPSGGLPRRRRQSGGVLPPAPACATFRVRGVPVRSRWGTRHAPRCQSRRRQRRPGGGRSGAAGGGWRHARPREPALHGALPDQATVREVVRPGPPSASPSIA